ncbi:MAG: DUF4129 domain-containing protein [Firmicutes bacterium]|nr:DUF4129 domain-containing protein [Bacillota bacterium]
MKERVVLAIAAAGMELAWLYALADFFFSLLMPQPFPLGGAVLTFALGFFLARLAKGRGWRVIYVLLLNLGSLGLVTFSLISRLGLMRPAGGQEQLALGLVVFWSSLFWLGGRALALRGFSHRALCSRFDAGIGAFIAFFLLGLGIEQPQGEGYLSVFSFFFFSILALALARDQGGGRREYLLGYRGIGLVLSFVALVLFLGPGLLFLLFPYLTKAAAAAYGMMRGAAAPLLPILVRILRFIFRFGGSPPGGETVLPEASGEILSAPATSGWMAVLERIMGWGLLAMAAAAGLVLLAWGIWKLIRWLSSSTEVGGEPFDIGQYLRSLWLALREHLQKMLQRPRYLSPIAELYARLLAWGRRRGLPPLPGETPREYGRRLSGYFPELDGDITQIVERFNEETYGGLALPEEELAMARRAWRRLSNPLARLPFKRK